MYDLGQERIQSWIKSEAIVNSETAVSENLSVDARAVRSVVLREVGGLGGVVATDRTRLVVTDRLLVIEGTHDDLGGQRFLDRLLTLLVATPRGFHVTAVSTKRPENLLAGVGFADTVVEVFFSSRIELRVHLVEVPLNRRTDIVAVSGDRLAVGAMDDRHLAVFDLVGADLNPDRNTLELPLVELEAGIPLVAVVEFYTDAAVGKVVGDLIGVVDQIGTMTTCSGAIVGGRTSP